MPECKACAGGGEHLMLSKTQSWGPGGPEQYEALQSQNKGFLGELPTL